MVITALLSVTAVAVADVYSAIRSKATQNGLALLGLSTLSESQLRHIVVSNHLTVYWGGSQENTEYLLNASNPSAIVLTMLPIDRPPKGIRATYPQITTYIVDNAFQVVLSGGGNPDVHGVLMPSGNSLYYSSENPDVAYVGIPGRNIEVEVFDPSQPQRLWLALLKDPGRLEQIT